MTEEMKLLRALCDALEFDVEVLPSFAGSTQQFEYTLTNRVKSEMALNQARWQEIHAREQGESNDRA